MSGTKISALTAAAAAADADLIPGVQSGADVKFTALQIGTYVHGIVSGLTAASSLAGTDVVAGMQFAVGGRKFLLSDLQAFVVGNRAETFPFISSSTGLNGGSSGVTAAYENLVKSAARVGVPFPTSPYTKVRLLARITAAGVAGTKVRLRYTTSFDTTVASALQMGASSTEVQIAADATGAVDSGWVTLVAGAIGDPIYLCPQQGGGDGSTSNPTMQHLFVLFR